MGKIEIGQQNLTITPNKNSINPEFKIKIPCKYSNIIICDIYGEIWYDHKSKLANLNFDGYHEHDNTFNDGDVYRSETFGGEPSVSSGRNPDIFLIAQLSKSAIDYIETERTKVQDSDVNLNLKITIKYLDKLLVPVDISEGNQIFLGAKKYQFPIQHTIPQSRWVKEFCPAFGIGEFFLFEYPLLKSEELNDFQDSSEIKKILDRSIIIAGEMKKYIKKGEWATAIQHARRISEILKIDDSKTDIKAILVNSGYTEEAYDKLIKSIQNLFRYTSEFHHETTEGNKQLKPDIPVNKEDAYLVYTMTINLIHLISTKLKRLSS